MENDKPLEYESPIEETQREELLRKVHEEIRKNEPVEKIVEEYCKNADPDRHKDLDKFREFMLGLNAIYDKDRELKNNLKPNENPQVPWNERVSFWKGEKK